MCVNPKIIYYNKYLKSSKFNGTLILDRTQENVNYCSHLVDSLGGQTSFIQCGKCVECLNKRSLEWSIRLSCEFETNFNKCYFLTLTYNDIFNTGNLNANHLKSFFKALNNRGYKIKYYAAGEYGSETLRPHYHIILWINGELDLIPYSDKLFTCDLINECWTFGEVKIGIADIGSIFYTAGYVNKKLGKKNDYGLVPEFQRFSKGIGLVYFNQNVKSIIDNDKIYLNGSSYGLPRYYSKLLKEFYPVEYSKMCKNRFISSFGFFNLNKKSERVMHLSYLEKEKILKEFQNLKKLREF